MESACRSVWLLFLAGLFRVASADSPAAPQRLVVEPNQLIFSSSGASSGASPGEEKSVTIANRGARTLTIRKVAIETDATGFQVQDPGMRKLEPGESLQLKVRYAPGFTGSPQAFGGMQIVCDDPRMPTDVRDPSLHVASVAMRVNPSNLLSWMIFFPLLGALVILLLPSSRAPLVRAIALASAAVPLVLCGQLLLHFDRDFSMSSGNFGLQFVQHLIWIPSFHVEYYVGVDGLSVTLVLLTTLVSFIAVLASFGIEKQVRGYFALLLLLETGMLGTFCALDFFLFYVFWEVMLLPMYFLIGIWGGARKEYAAIKFFLYTLFGSVLMLLALIALYYHSAPTTLVDGTPARHTFDLMKLAYRNHFDTAPLLFGFEFSKVIWVALFIGFAIKIPMFPLHTWLPDAHVEAPTAISVILAGILLKMGVYGVLRLNFAILPSATAWASLTMAAFGAINILYGAFCAFAQRDLKKLVAYSSVSHMGYCLLGMAAFTQSGVSGAMLQLFNHGTITAMLFLLVGVLYDRAHTREIDHFGGVASQMPRYAAFFGLAFMASLGLPGLSGFIGEVLVFLGAFPVYRALTLAALTGVVFTAGYHLWAMQRVQLGRWNDLRWTDRSRFPDLSARELVTLVPLAVLVVLFGFYPMPLLELSKRGLDDLLRHLASHAATGHAAGSIASLF